MSGTVLVTCDGGLHLQDQGNLHQWRRATLVMEGGRPQLSLATAVPKDSCQLVRQALGGDHRYHGASHTTDYWL